MHIFYWMIELIACVADAWIYLFALNNLVNHENKVGKMKYMAAFLLLSAFGMIANLNIGAFGAVVSISFYLVFLLYGFLSLQGNKKEIFIIATIIHVAMGMIAMSVCNILNMAIDRPMEEFVVPASGMIRIYLLFICKLTALFLVIMIVLWFKRSRRTIHLKEWNWLIFEYIIVMGMIILSMMIWMNVPSNETIGIMTFLLDMGLVLVFVVTFHMMRKSAEYYRVQNEYEHLMGTIHQEQSLLEERRQEYEQMQLFRHDLKHYLGTAVGMAQKNQNEEVLQYLKEILHEHIELGNDYIALDNSILEAVINAKITRMKEEKIAFDIVIAEGVNYQNPINVGVILSNLIDNAIEAALRCEEKARNICLVSRLVRGYVVFEIRNSISESVLENNPKLHTTKEDKMGHGFGMKSVHKMVEEEDGILRISESNMQYIVEIYLPVERKNG